MPIDQSLLIYKSVNFRESYQTSSDFSAHNRKTAFLCHSHKDELLVKGLLQLLEEFGAYLYVDWNDHALPDSPNADTAKRIQNKIKSGDVFLLLATANSKASHWCPWEIGYADSSNKNIYIIPTFDRTGTYGNEYLELYSKIELDAFANKLEIFDPGNKVGKRINSVLM